MASDGESILGRVVCPQCGKTGMIGDPGLDRVSYSSESNESPRLRLPRVLCQCGQDFVADVDQFVLSNDPWFQYLGLLGAESLITFMDEEVIHPFDLPDGKTGTLKHIASGTVEMEFHDPSTGAVLFKKALRVADHPQLLVAPGIVRVCSLPKPVDSVLAVALHCKDVDVASHVHLYSEPHRSSTGQIDSVSIACVVDQPDLVQKGPFDVAGFAVVVPVVNVHSRWLRLICEALAQSINSNYELALLGFAKSVEVFVKEYLDETLIHSRGCPPDIAAKSIDHFDQISERLRYLVPLAINADLPEGIIDTWDRQVALLRNRYIAHDPGAKTHHTGSTRAPRPEGPLTKIEARQAFEATYRLIRVMQKKCPLTEGRDFDFWCRPRQDGTAIG